MWYGRKIGQYTTDGKLIGIYDNVFLASKRTAFTVHSIHISLEHGKPNKQGWIWKYVIKDETKRERPSGQSDRGYAQFRVVLEPIQEEEKETLPQGEDEGIL